MACAIAAFSECEDAISKSLALKVEVCSEAYRHPTKHAFAQGTLKRFGQLVVRCQQQQQQQSGALQAPHLGVARALDALASAIQLWVSSTSGNGRRHNGSSTPGKPI